jgi:nicotinate-nucleotide pyrophosphorylase (carboxylating)
MGNHVITAHQWTILNGIIERGLKEDLGSEGDVTSQAIFGLKDTAVAVIKSKAAGILAGSFLIGPIFNRLDPSVAIRDLISDGSPLAPGDRIGTIAGPVRALLAGERLVLNFLQRLSGIASLTRRYADAVAHTRARLLDTRKTTPTLRLLEKMAVAAGGGHNHRIGLYDMLLIKDTHSAACGGAAAALRRAQQSPLSEGRKIEIEVQNMAEFAEVLPLRPFRIMLDNMSIGDMRQCVALRDQQKLPVELEASGNVTLEKAASVAETGVDFISCGQLTHSASALDIHMIITG